METKNTGAVDKIIAKLAMMAYRAANPRTKDGKPKYKTYRPYTLPAEAEEAREIKAKYLRDEITEEQYKAWCLRYNLTH